MKVFLGKFLGVDKKDIEEMLNNGGEFSLPNNVHTIAKKAFFGIKELVSVKIPASVKVIEERGFRSCNNLLKVVFEDNSLLTTIGDNAFCCCNNLTSINLPLSVISIGKEAFNTCFKIQTIVFEENSYLQSIGEEAFTFCESLTAVCIPKSVTKIGKKAFYFSNGPTIFCEHDEKPSGWDDEWCLDEEAIVVWGCERIEIDGYTYVFGKSGDEYYACLVKVEPFITEFKVHETLKGHKYILKGANLESLSNSKVLTSIVIPSCVTSISDGFFSNCSSLKTVIFEKDSKLKEIGSDAFRWCEQLESIIIPKSVLMIGDCAFICCKNLKTVDFEEGDELEDLCICGSAFNSCESLETFSIPSRTSIMEDNIFYKCINLQTVIFKKGIRLKFVHSSNFSECTNLKKFIFEGTSHEWGQIKSDPEWFRATKHIDVECTEENEEE